MTKHAIKFLSGAGLLVLMGFGALYALPFFDPQQRAARDLVKKEEEMKQAIYADTYGGNTPQETLDLYIEAIKKRDIDLAVKYYVIPKQEGARKELSNLTDDGVKNILIHVSAAKNGQLEIETDMATFSYIQNITGGYIIVDNRKIPVPDGETERTIQLGRNPNRKWKIIFL